MSRHRVCGSYRSNIYRCGCRQAHPEPLYSTLYKHASILRPQNSFLPSRSSCSMVQTRAQERGAPLKKPGAYNTDAYYDEVDQGFGDVGVDQEPDAARTQAENKDDPDFSVSKEEMTAADTAAAEEPAQDVRLKEDIADLKAGPAEDVNTAAKDGTPVGIVPTSREEVEAQEVFTGAGIEEGVSSIPDKA